MKIKTKIWLSFAIDAFIDTFLFLMLLAILGDYLKTEILVRWWFCIPLFIIFFLTVSIISIGTTAYTFGFYFVGLRFIDYRMINYKNFFLFNVENFSRENLKLSQTDVLRKRLSGRSQGIVIAGEAFLVIALTKGLSITLHYYFPHFQQKYIPVNSEIFIVLFLFHFLFPVFFGAGPYSVLTKNYLLDKKGEQASWWKFFIRVILMISTLGLAPYIIIDKKKKIYLDDWVSQSFYVCLVEQKN